VAPVLNPVFGDLPLASLPANVLAAPLLGPITIGGLTAGTIGGVTRTFAPGLSAVLLAPVVALVQALQGIAAATSRLPFSIDGRAAVGLIAVGCGALGCRAILRGLARRPAGRLDPVQSPRARLPRP
jgi:predicted membrane metal-binding protein